MSTWRRKMVDLVLRFALVAGIVLLPMPISLAESDAAAVGQEEEEKASEGEMENAGDTKPGTEEQVTLMDTGAGELIDRKAPDAGKVPKPLSRDIKDTAVEPDSVTAIYDAGPAPIDAHAGKELMSATTDGHGNLVLKGIPEGPCIVLLGNPGMGSVLVVGEGAELAGTVSYPDAKSFAAEVSVRVWSVKQKKFVYETATDKKGAYKLPGLAPGKYLVVFGDRVMVEALVEKAAKSAQDKLDVIIPHGKGPFAHMTLDKRAASLTALGATGEEMAGENAGIEAGGVTKAPLLRTLVLGAGGVATAVGILAITGDHGGGGGEVVSP